MRVAQLKRRPKYLHNFTGLSVVQFKELVAALGAEVTGAQVVKRPRQRAVGGGRGRLQSEASA